MSANSQLQSPATGSPSRDPIKSLQPKPVRSMPSESPERTAPPISADDAKCDFKAEPPSSAQSLPVDLATAAQSKRPETTNPAPPQSASTTTDQAPSVLQSAAKENSAVPLTSAPERLEADKSAEASSDDLDPMQPAAQPAFYGVRSYISQAVVASFIGGGMAGAVSRTVVSPLERLKILLQVQSTGRTEYKMSISKALGKIWREEGFKGMMAGNGTNCMRIVPYSAVQFGSYGLYKPIFESYPDEPLSAVKRLTCGAMAGITSVSVTYPLDIVRTRLSIQSASFRGLTPAQAQKKLPGMWQTLAHMYATEGGIGALYRGIIPTVAGVAPYVGLNFMIYESVRQYFTPEGEKNPSSVGKLCAGAISGAAAQTATYPFDVLRRRFQINTMSGMGYQYKSIFDAVRVIVANEGASGLYKGIAPNLLKVAPSMASSWLTFEMTRDFMVSLKPEIVPTDEPARKVKSAPQVEQVSKAESSSKGQLLPEKPAASATPLLSEDVSPKAQPLLSEDASPKAQPLLKEQPLLASQTVSKETS